MIRRDAAAAAVMLAFGLVAGYHSTSLPFGTVHNPGPGFFPWWTSVFIVFLGLLCLLQAFSSRPGVATEGGGRIGKVIGLLAVLTVYVFLLDVLGYPLCTFLLLLFMLRVTDLQRWSLALGMAAITAVGSYIVFAMWLSVPLPRGPL